MSVKLLFPIALSLVVCNAKEQEQRQGQQPTIVQFRIETASFPKKYAFQQQEDYFYWHFAEEPHSWQISYSGDKPSVAGSPQKFEFAFNSEPKNDRNLERSIILIGDLTLMVDGQVEVNLPINHSYSYSPKADYALRLVSNGTKKGKTSIGLEFLPDFLSSRKKGEPLEITAKSLKKTAQLQKKPKPLSGTVVIKGDPIVVPHIPTSASQGRKEQRTLLKSLAKTRYSLEEDLLLLCKDFPLEKMPISILLPIEKYELHETNFLLSILRDTTIDSRLNKMLIKWNAWQATLFKYELLHFNNPQSVKLIKGIESYELDTNTMKKIETAQLMRVRNLNKMKTELISDSILPDFSKTWEELRMYMNERIQTLVGLSGSKNVSQDADIKHLYDTASIILFEQTRLMLWICNLIWSRINNYAKSDSLKNINFYSFLTQIDHDQNMPKIIVVRQSLISINQSIIF
jgi:hypothetical protein